MSEQQPHRSQAREMAHLRPLGRCRVCGAPATEELYTGLNEPVARYCSRHAMGALRAFKTDKA